MSSCAAMGSRAPLSFSRGPARAPKVLPALWGRCAAGLRFRGITGVGFAGARGGGCFRGALSSSMRRYALINLSAKGWLCPKSTVANDRPSRSNGVSHRSKCAGKQHCRKIRTACKKHSNKHSLSTSPPPGASGSVMARPHCDHEAFRRAACRAMPADACCLNKFAIGSWLRDGSSVAAAAGACEFDDSSARALDITEPLATASCSANSGHG
mmetsp:Transcript_129238/g.374171  ORF Transcript_129238/g.374171 Transcript_129238/m.374171 type:complete len:212 (-) Transcript_129238:1748-2383(-)